MWIYYKIKASKNRDYIYPHVSVIYLVKPIRCVASGFDDNANI